MDELAFAAETTRRGEHQRARGPSSFVGRAGDLSAIKARFDEGARLVTVLSPGGMGKTRAATWFARLHGEGFAAHGGGARGSVISPTRAASTRSAAWWRRSSACRSSAAPTSARSSPTWGAPSPARARAPRPRQPRAPAREAARVVRAWMILAPDARFLATSRAVLGVPGEHLVHLEPLCCRGRGSRRWRSWRPRASISSCAARAGAPRLRSERGRDRGARRRGPRDRRDPAGDRARRGAVAVLTLEQIERRLATPLDLLVRRDDTGKHASMRRVIVDSFAQLDEVMRRRLAASSVFRGGFTLEAAESVLDGPRGGVLATLDALVARSLVRAREAPGSCASRASRRSASSPRRSSRRCPARARRSRRGTRATTRPSAPRSPARPRRPAAARCGRGSGASSTTSSRPTRRRSRRPRVRRGRGGRAGLVARPRARAGAPRARPARPRPARARRGPRRRGGRRLAAPGFAEALVARGNTRRELGDLDRARQDIAAGLALAQRSGDVALEAQACMRWGEIVESSGETEEARAHFVRGLARLAEAPADRLQRPRGRDPRASATRTAARAISTPPSARSGALALYREAGCDDELPTALYEAAVIALFRRRYDEAHAHFDEALALARAGGLKQAEGALSSALGILVQEEGRIDEALGHHAHAVRLFREIGSRIREASALYYLGGAFLERGSAGRRRSSSRRRSTSCAAPGCPATRCSSPAASPWRRPPRASATGRRPGSTRRAPQPRRARRSCRSRPRSASTRPTSRSTACRERAPRARRSGARAHRGSGQRRRALSRGASCWRGRGRTRGRRRPRWRSSRRERASSPRARRRRSISRAAPRSRRILFALATLRVEAPGEPLSMDEVVRAGWPGERIGSEAAANRVRVALATLRKLGLRRAIVTGQGGT